MKYAKQWKLAKDAYNGEGGFLNGDYINKYPRELENKIEQRREIAYYTNIFASKVSRFIGYIYKQKPVRDTKSNILKIILDDIDMKKNSANIFFSNFAKNAKVYGCNLILIDMPTALPDNLKDQMQQRAFPYTVEIDPQRVLNYKLDNYGNFEYVFISDTMLNEKGKVVEIKRYYDNAQWVIYDKDDNALDKGEHNLGVTPVLIFSEDGLFPTTGEFTQIANLAKRHYNLQSELDEILRGQTFSILTMQTSSSGDIKLSTDNALLYQKDADRPEFIAPPSAPAEMYRQRIKDIEEQIDTIAYDITTNKSTESGIALSIKFQGLNASLSSFAQRLEDFELRVYEVIAKYLKETSDVTVSYAKEFSIVDINQEIAILEQMQGLISSPTYFKLKAMQIITNDLSSADNADITKIESEIEDSLKA